MKVKFTLLLLLAAALPTAAHTVESRLFGIWQCRSEPTQGFNISYTLTLQNRHQFENSGVLTVQPQPNRPDLVLRYIVETTGTWNLSGNVLALEFNPAGTSRRNDHSASANALLNETRELDDLNTKMSESQNRAGEHSERYRIVGLTQNRMTLVNPSEPPVTGFECIRRQSHRSTQR